MRDDVCQVSFADMTPALRSLICYEPNHSLNVEKPQELIDDVRRTTPVVRWEMGVGFFEMDDILAAARNPDLVSADPTTGRAIGMGSPDALIPLHLDGEIHRHYRRLLDPLFTAKKMVLLEPQIRALADELIDGFIADGHVEMHDAFCVPLPSTIFLNLFGMPLEDASFLIEKKNRILKNEGTSMEEMDAIGVAAGLEMRVRLRARLDERRADGGRHDDLLDSFLHFEVDGHTLNDDEVVNIMHMFTIAGLDTVTSSLSCILAWFAHNPTARHHVIAHPETLRVALEEIMRYESPVPSGGVRMVVRDTEINGVSVPAGNLVYLCWASANLDPSVFECPLDPNLARENNRHIVYAAGTHRCLGSHLARAELRAAVDQFHRRVSDYWITEGAEVEYEFAGVRQAKHLPLTFTVR